MAEERRLEEQAEARAEAAADGAVMGEPIRPEQVRLPTDRIPAPNPADVLLNGDDYQPQPIAPSVPEAQAGDLGYEL